MKNYYFTFGTDPQYPYGIDDYTKITGLQASELIEKYKSLEK